MKTAGFSTFFKLHVVCFKWPQVGLKLAQVGLKLAQDGPMLPQDGSMLPQVGPTWPQVALTWLQLGLKLAPTWPKFGPSWLKLAQVGPSCPHLGLKANPTEKTRCFWPGISCSGKGPAAGGGSRWEGVLGEFTFGKRWVKKSVFALATPCIYKSLRSTASVSLKAQWPDLQWGWRPQTGH